MCVCVCMIDQVQIVVKRYPSEKKMSYKHDFKKCVPLLPKVLYILTSPKPGRSAPSCHWKQRPMQWGSETKQQILCHRGIWHDFREGSEGQRKNSVENWAGGFLVLPAFFGAKVPWEKKIVSKSIIEEVWYCQNLQPLSLQKTSEHANACIARFPMLAAAPTKGSSADISFLTGSQSYECVWCLHTLSVKHTANFRVVVRCDQTVLETSWNNLSCCLLSSTLSAREPFHHQNTKRREGLGLSLCLAKLTASTFPSRSCLLEVDSSRTTQKWFNDACLGQNVTSDTFCLQCDAKLHHRPSEFAQLCGASF